MDYREIPHAKGHFNKIVSLEMAEHVGIRRYGTFLKQVYDLLADDGVFVMQVAGIRTCWQYEDLNWGLLCVPPSAARMAPTYRLTLKRTAA